jgi:tellurite resistance protein
VEKDQNPGRQKFPGPRVPPNLFGIALGIAGLAEAWHAAVPLLGTTQAIPDALSILDAALWLVLVGAYLAQGPRIVMADLRDPVLSPFVSASALTAMLLAAALAKDAFAAGRVLVVVFLAVTVGVGGWLTGQWMTGGIEPDSVHPGYFLPTAAGGLIGADAAAQVHLHALAEASFGIGVISWVLLGSMILNRLFTRPALPSALVPTMAIELGIPAVAGSAYFAVAGRTVSFVACVLGGYAVLMALVQVRLIPVYRRLSFTPGFWSFAFAYAAAAADALVWLAIKKPPAATGYAIALIALLTAFVAWIAFRTVVLAVRGQLFPAWPPVHQARLLHGLRYRQALLTGRARAGTRLQGHPGDRDDDGRYDRRYDRCVRVRVPEHQVAEEGTGGHTDYGSDQAPRRVCGERPGDEAAEQVDVGGGKGRGGDAWHVE